MHYSNPFVTGGQKHTHIDPNWITKSTCIVTSNVDRVIINAEAAKAFGKRNNVPVLRWKRKLCFDVPLSAKIILHDKDERP
jgi:hypothetical protein